MQLRQTSHCKGHGVHEVWYPDEHDRRRLAVPRGYLAYICLGREYTGNNLITSPCNVFPYSLLTPSKYVGCKVGVTQPEPKPVGSLIFNAQRVEGCGRAGRFTRSD